MVMLQDLSLRLNVQGSGSEISKSSSFTTKIRDLEGYLGFAPATGIPKFGCTLKTLLKP